MKLFDLLKKKKQKTKNKKKKNKTKQNKTKQNYLKLLGLNENYLKLF